MSMCVTGTEDEELDPEVGDHNWHFRYNRRLACFSNSISSLTFSKDGQWLVSGTGSGDVKVWDTGCWAEAAKLKGSKREEPRALVISPAQRWLVSAYASVLYIFQCEPPWRLEQALPAICCPFTKETSEWSCVAFSPMAEVDHPQGHTGQDNHLAAFSTMHLCVLDYSGGWGDTPRRTRSLLYGTKATCLAYTACGWWLVCGYESGQLQVWNAFSLTLERTLCAHQGQINGLTSSPPDAGYDTRFISCGSDQSLRVWHSSGWILEQVVPDTRCDRAGVRGCTFSSFGNWVVSVANELCVWRVVLSMQGRLMLRLHQRLAAVCGAEGLRAAAFGSCHDAIAVGSRDGVLGLWTKCTGMPPDPPQAASVASPSKGQSVRSEPWRGDRPLPRPMQRITPEGLKPLAARASTQKNEEPPKSRAEWFQRAHLRSLSMSNLAGRNSPGTGNSSAASTAGRLAVTPDSSRRMTSVGNEAPEITTRATMIRTNTEIVRWKTTNCVEFKDVLNVHCEEGKSSSGNGLNTPPQKQIRKSMSMSNIASNDLGETEPISPIRQSMLRATRGKVQRISLEPKVITDNTL